MVELMANEEGFVEVDQSRVEHAVFVEESPDQALEKLLNLSNSSNRDEIVGYVKHLGELSSLIGVRIISHLPGILMPIVPFQLLFRNPR